MPILLLNDTAINRMYDDAVGGDISARYRDARDESKSKAVVLTVTARKRH